MPCLRFTNVTSQPPGLMVVANSEAKSPSGGTEKLLHSLAQGALLVRVVP
jgi:hypothetical protein